MGNNNSPYSNFTPGKMSDELIEALGLPKNGIPAHVYNMREHGYPGGWLDDARKEYSGISIFTAPNECNHHFKIKFHFCSFEFICEFTII